MTVRARRRVALGAAVVLFLAASAIVARWLAADGSERAQVERILEAQARGDAEAMASEIDGCDARCRSDVGRLAARLRAPGTVEIVRYDSKTSHALSSTSGATRVVWRRGDAIPIVQCFAVRRDGGLLTGPRVTLTDLSAPIGLEAAC